MAFSDSYNRNQGRQLALEPHNYGIDPFNLAHTRPGASPSQSTRKVGLGQPKYSGASGGEHLGQLIHRGRTVDGKRTKIPTGAELTQSYSPSMQRMAALTQTQGPGEIPSGAQYSGRSVGNATLPPHLGPETLGYNTASQGISFASPEQIDAYRAPKAGTKAWYDAMGPGQADLVNQIGSIQGAHTGDMRAASRLVDDGRGGYKRVAVGGLVPQAAKTAAISPLAKALAELRGEQLSAEGKDRRTSALERNAALGAETAQGQTAALERNAALTARTTQQQLAENRQQFEQMQGLDERKHLADEAERAEASRLAAQEQINQQNFLDLGSRGRIPLPENWPIMSDAERAEWIEWGHLLGDNSVLPELPK